IYALSGGLTQGGFTDIAWFRGDQYAPPEYVKEWFQHEIAERSGISLENLPEPIKQYVETIAKSFTDSLGERLTKEIQRCFSGTLDELVRKQTVESFFLSCNQENPKSHLDFILEHHQLRLLSAKIELSDFPFHLYKTENISIQFLETIIPVLFIWQVF